MFFVAGILSKIKPAGVITSCACPVCGSTFPLHVIHKYMTPHIFFIPTVHFHSEFIVTCASCASVAALSPEKGRAFRKDPAVTVFPEDLTVLQNNMR